jgi:hypothetical protein
VRTIGIARARFKIGMMNLGYNIRRLVQLERRHARGNRSLSHGRNCRKPVLFEVPSQCDNFAAKGRL